VGSQGWFNEPLPPSDSPSNVDLSQLTFPSPSRSLCLYLCIDTRCSHDYVSSLSLSLSHTPRPFLSFIYIYPSLYFYLLLSQPSQLRRACFDYGNVYRNNSTLLSYNLSSGSLHRIPPPRHIIPSPAHAVRRRGPKPFRPARRSIAHTRVRILLRAGLLSHSLIPLLVLIELPRLHVLLCPARCYGANLNG
jgi:hypothetical protein